MSLESKVIRAFVAIYVPDDVLSQLAQTQRELRALLPRNSTAWTKPESMHLTLRFLGNIAPTSVSELANRLRAALGGFGALDLVCERLGCFPDLRYPRVVWAGVHAANERLQQLHHCVDEVVREYAEKPAEARFVGHVTLARPRQIRRHDADRLARFVEAAVDRSFGRWTATEVLLLRSELLPSGAKYHELARVGFG